MAQFRAMGIISGTRSVLVRDVQFGRYKRTKKQTSAIATVDVLLIDEAKLNIPILS